ncbi:MAG: mechanosensitive ion channel [Nanoarchaeota archaeon]|nr:mechanosensitive ion channel [Nanoarchaeota archaeon]
MADLFINPFNDAVIISLISAGVYLLVGLIVISLLMKITRSFINDNDIKKMLKRIGIGIHGIDIIMSGIKLYLYFILILIILGRLGVSSFLTDVIILILIIAVMGILLLSLKNFVPNAAAGLYISSTNMISKNDKIVVDKLEGRVDEINLLNTILKKNNKEKIIIPNAILIKKKVVKK